MKARLRFHGAAREVTGSMHLLELNGNLIAVDCGMFQGRRAEANIKNATFPFEPSRLDAVVLSHAHLDHCGKLPRLVRAGFKGEIYATPATCDLAGILLADSAKIQEEDAEYFNKKHAKNGEPPIQPLYSHEDVERTLPLFRKRELGASFEVVPGLRARFHEAGHMLGSAGISLEITPNGAPSARITFTGDLGRSGMPILRDPAPLPPCEYLICESTYGGRLTPPAESMKLQLAQVLNETFGRGGKVIVPSFAVGRTQMIVYHYHELVREHLISGEVPLYIDSPLATRATEVYDRHPETYDREATEFNHRTNNNMLHCERCEYVPNVEASKALHEQKGPLMILAASGMCEAGRILHHLKNNIEDPNNTILFVGFQAANTLGRRLIEHVKRVKIFGEFYQVRAKIKVLNGFSAHANAKELTAAVKPLADDCKQAFLVHGEPDQCEALAATLSNTGFNKVTIPEPGAKFDIT